jgi:hypothetical protein
MGSSLATHKQYFLATEYFIGYLAYIYRSSMSGILIKNNNSVKLYTNNIKNICFKCKNIYICVTIKPKSKIIEMMKNDLLIIGEK